MDVRSAFTFPDQETIEVRETVFLRDLDARAFVSQIPNGPRPRFVWRGPATDPVFCLQNCREATFAHLDVVCETPCEAVFLIERTKTGPGVIPSTLHQFRDVRIFGNGVARHGYWVRATIDENNEHGRWDACSVYGARVGWSFAGQQSKEHLLTQCRFESGAAAIEAESGFQWISGTAAVCEVGISLTRVGEPVLIQGVGFEACARLLRGPAASTASQPVTLMAVRYEADQLNSDGDCIVIQHSGPLRLEGCRLGGGKQRVPRIALLGIGLQSALIAGNTFGAFGEHRVCPIRAQQPANAKIEWRANTYQRDAQDPQNTESRISWAPRFYA
jgi:hypothetical protein